MAPEHRSADLGLAVPTVPLDSKCDHDDQAGDCDPLASTRLSGLLALEIRELIRHPSRENPVWGAHRSHGLQAGRDIVTKHNSDLIACAEPLANP